MRHVSRGGSYFRVADPSWDDPLSSEHARLRGGRWNPPRSFGVVYLNASREVARAQVRRKLEPRGIRPEDLDPAEGPSLVGTEVPRNRYVEAISKEGLAALGLPDSYPLDELGRTAPHSVCQPIGAQARKAGEHGIACLSAAPAAPRGGEELTYFGSPALRAERVEPFVDWYWDSG